MDMIQREAKIKYNIFAYVGLYNGEKNEVFENKIQYFQAWRIKFRNRLGKRMRKNISRNQIKIVKNEQ